MSEIPEIKKMLEAWAGKKMIVWSEAPSNGHRLYKAFHQYFPALNVSYCPLQINAALLELNTQMPDVIFYVVSTTDNEEVRTNKFAFFGACSGPRGGNQLIVTVALSKDLKTTPLDPILDDLCDDQKLLRFMVRLKAHFPEFEASAKTR